MRIGFVGLGTAGLAAAHAVRTGGADTIVGGVDIDAEARQRFTETFGVPTFGSQQDLRRGADVDAVWIATPTFGHESDTCSAAAIGLHVVVEKPMATSLDGARRMIEACSVNDVHLISGGSRSSSATVRAARAMLNSGRIGRLRAMTSLAATDWLLRPRRPDEYDIRAGGGVVLRQAPHVVDTFRYLAGGMVRQVRGVTGHWMRGRGTAPGFFSAILEFEGDVTATCTYDGHGHFMASELFGPHEAGPRSPNIAGRLAERRAIESGADETATKAARLERLGTEYESPIPRREPFLADIGILVVHGEEGNLRQSPNGLFVYGPDGVTDEPVEPIRGGPPELAELRSAIDDGAPLLHSGAWGLATLEVCVGIIESAQLHRDVTMRHQVPVPFDA